MQFVKYLCQNSLVIELIKTVGVSVKDIRQLVCLGLFLFIFNHHLFWVLHVFLIEDSVFWLVKIFMFDKVNLGAYCIDTCVFVLSSTDCV